MIKFVVMFLLQIAPPIYSNLKKPYHNIL
jgi:hypothetical protein